VKEYAKHKVTVFRDEVLTPNPRDLNSKWVQMIPSGRTYLDWDIEHTEECDKLKYGLLCCLDWMLEHDSDDGMPEEDGIYEVWVVDNSGYVNNWSHCGWEAEYYIQFNKLGELPEDYDEIPGLPDSVL